MEEKIRNRVIDENATITEAIKQMDAQRVKLLFVLRKSIFRGLISIGDIQRAIIDNKPFETPIKELIRKDLIVFYDTDSTNEIKQVMLKYRIECMPILNSQQEVINAIFWEELFQDQSVQYQKLENPVVIMAGGRGTRLKPLTNVIPKPLIPIGERTIIEEIIQEFGKHQIKHFFISVNYKHELIKFHFDHIEDRQYDVEYIIEKDFFGTAGSLKMLEGKINTTFFVSNCDIVVDTNYAEIMDFHRGNNNMLTVVASLKHYKIPYGTIKTGENGNLVQLIEKPELTFFLNTGFYILEPEILKYIPKNQFYNITDLIMLLKEKGQQVGVFPISENSWKDMGEWPEYQKMVQKYRN